MTKSTYIFLLIFLSISLQVFAGNTGLILPFIALSIFYLTIIFDWHTGIITAAIAGLIIDILYGKAIFVSSLLLIVIVLIAITWQYKGELKYLPFQCIPAGIISFIYICPGLLINYHEYDHGTYLMFGKILILFLSLVFSALIFPPFIILMDKINSQLKLNLYTTSKERIAKE